MTRLSILIADDDPVVLMILRHNLQLAGFDVHDTASGTQAVNMATRRAFDAVVLDMRMPDLDGLQAAHAIRDHHPAHDLPIILMSARPDAESRDKALDAGADAFMPKPFRSRELATRIQSLREAHAERVIAAVPSSAQAVAVSPTADPPLPATVPSFMQQVVTAPRPPQPRLTPGLPAPSVPFPNTPLWIDLDHDGRVRDASAASLAALHMSSVPAGLTLETILHDTHELIPSLTWSELSVAMQNGFLRVLSPRRSVAASHRAYEVHVERTPAGCRLRLLDVTDSLLAHAANHTRS